MDEAKLYRDSNGFITCKLLTNEEVSEYMAMPVGIAQTADMIRWVAEDEEERQIIEQTANGYNRIKIRKRRAENDN